MAKSLPKYHITVRQKERGASGSHTLVGQIHFIGIPATNWENARRKAVKLAATIGLVVTVEHSEKAL